MPAPPRHDTPGADSPLDDLPGESLRRLTILITALGAVLRFSAITRQSFWYDEAISMVLARMPLGDLLTGQARDLGNPPLHAALLHLWINIFGGSDAAARSLSAVLGTLTIPVFVGLARTVVPAKIALLAGTLLAISPFHIQMAQETRCYTLLALLGTLATWAVIQATKTPTRNAPWLAVAVLTAAMALTHYFAFFLAIAHAVYLAVAYRHDRRILLRGLGAYVLAAGLFLFWLPHMLLQMKVQGNLARSADSWYMHLVATPLVFGFGTSLVWKDAAQPARLILGGLGAVTFCVVLVAGVRSLFAGNVMARFRSVGEATVADLIAAEGERRRSTHLLILWLVLPALIPAVVSLLASPIYNTRYVILASLPFYVFSAVGLLALPRVWRTGAAGIIVLATAGSMLSYLNRPVKHQWREAVAYLESLHKPDDLIVFNSEHNETAYAHYAGASTHRLRLYPKPRDLLMSAPAAAEVVPLPGHVALYGATYAGGAIRDIEPYLLQQKRIWLVTSDPDRDVAARTAVFFAPWKAHPVTHLRGIDIQLFEAPGATPAPPTP